MPKPQKIGVLTFHRCINYGSYWQARALADGLRRMGHDAVLLDHRSARVTRAEWRNTFQPVRPRRTPRCDFPLYARKARKFLQAIERLPLSRPFQLEQPAGMEPCDTVVVGSDEVWNFGHPWYAGCPVFFGEGIRSERLVSYAASFGCHDAGDPLQAPWSTRLQRFSALAVRDDNSRRLVREGLGEDPALVLDPCLQFPEICRRPAPTVSNEALVYGHSFPDGFAQAARAWADGRGVRLVSIGYRNDWCDEQRLCAGPEEFAQAMGQARAVLTEFFHGCVFALVNVKPFACSLTRYRSHKIAGLLRTVSAENRIMRDEPPAALDAAIASALDRPPGEATRARLATLRRRSADYLRHALP